MASTDEFLIVHDQVARWSGYSPEQISRIREFLDRNGIRYTIGQGGRVCTCRDAVRACMLRDQETIEFT